MKKSFYTIFAVFVALNFSQAQTKIKDGTVAGSSSLPVNSAVLELESTNKGLLYPRVSLASTSSWGLSGTATAGTIVYNTNASISSTIANPKLPGGIGSYYWDGSRWVGTGATANMVQWPYATNDGVIGTSGNAKGIINVPGSGNVASGNYSHAEGLNNTASGVYSLAFGNSNSATAANAHAFGNSNTASGAYSLAGGSSSQATGSYCFAFGNSNNIGGFASAGFGTGNSITGTTPDKNFVAGHGNTITSSNTSTAFGYGNSIASATNGFAAGWNNTVGGTHAFAFGRELIANEWQAFSVGFNVDATGGYCISMGHGNMNMDDSGCMGICDRIITSDGISTILRSTAENQFNARFRGGYRLFTNGTLTTGVSLAANGTSWSSISDRRSKNSISEIKYGLNTVMQLRPSMYKYNGNDNTSLGFIAQEVNEVIPEVIEQTTMGPNHDYLAIKYTEMIPVLTKAIQELNAKIEVLEKENERLKSGNEKLVSEVNQLNEMHQQYAELSDQVKSLQRMMGINTTAPNSETH